MHSRFILHSFDQLRTGSSAFSLVFVRVSIVLLFILWSAMHLDGFSWDYDEGVHVYIAWLVQQGHPLYTETFSPYTPGFIVALLAAFNGFGATVFTARMVAVSFAALGLLGVMMSAGELVKTLAPALYSPPELVEGGERGSGSEGVLAELFAAALLSVAPSFFQWSRAAMSDASSASLSALAVAFALIYVRAQQLRWLFAAEILFAGALWVKLISIGGAAAIALALLLVLRARRDDIKRALLGSLLIGVLALLPLLFFDARNLYEQAIYFHIQKRAAYLQSLTDNVLILMDFLSSNLTLSTLAAFGAVTTLLNPVARHVSHAKHITSLWFLATFVSLIAQTPLFAHHLVVLAFPLAALAGAGAAFLIIDFRFWSSQLRSLPRQFITLSILALSIFGLGQYPESLRAAVAPPFQPVAAEAVALLEALTPNNDLLVSDAQMIAFRAERPSPPALADTSQARLASGNLTAEQLSAVVQQSNTNGILFWSGRLETLPTFVDWAERNYHLVRSSFQKPNSPYRLLLREPHPQYPLRAQFGERITLWGYDLNRRSNTPITAGQTLSLTLYFQRTGVVEKPYTVFAHLLNMHGQIVAQEDHPPLAGRYTTNQWRTDEFIVDEYAMPLDEADAGDYQFEIGMYSRETLQRLPISVAGAPQPEDRLLLYSISVRANSLTH